MGFESPPSFPGEDRPDIAVTHRQDSPPGRAQAIRILIDLAMAAGLVVLVVWLRATSDRMARPAAADGPPPLRACAELVDFAAVEYWYARPGLFHARAAVEAELGSPTERVPWDQDLVKRMAAVEHSNRHLGVPWPQEWVRWVDPKDPARSVTVLFAGDQVYDRFKSGN